MLGDAARGGPLLAERLASPEIEALDPRDRAFLHELVLGTFRHRGALDHALQRLLTRPLDRLPAPALDILRLGAYQVLHLRVPDRAAVSESVDLAHDHAPRQSGVVNAVLRRLAREGPPAWPDPERDPLAWLTSEGSLPRWLAERWLMAQGTAGAVARARALLAPPVAAFRLNPRVPDALEQAQGAGLEPRPLLVPGAWEAAAGIPAPLAAANVLYVQDQGSQLVARLAAGPGRRLDACAAPGGKSTLMADVAAGRGLVVSAEVSARRLLTLARTLARWGNENVVVVGADARRPPFARGFEAVLLDAPCSGLGTLGRHPDIRWRARSADLPRHRERQHALIGALAPLVKEGGLLVYSVCSPEPEEGAEVVAAFQRQHPHFAPAPPPSWAEPFRAPDDPDVLSTRPEAHGGDAFFAAVLRRS